MPSFTGKVASLARIKNIIALFVEGSEGMNP